MVKVAPDIKMADLTVNSRVALRNDSHLLYKLLPSKVDPMVPLMRVAKVPDATCDMVGGLTKQIKEMKEVIELPIKHPELFDSLGISQPKGVLMYGPPGTGKTLLARALANNLEATFLKVVASAIVDKYIGESARIIREMFGYAREHEPCVIFMDEVDAIGGRRLSQGTSADREIQRTLMELLNQLDGFEQLGKVKMVCIYKYELNISRT